MRLHLHKYRDIKHQCTRNMCFGLAGCELPGQRVVQKCKKCGKKRYINLTLFMPNKYLYMEEIWKDD